MATAKQTTKADADKRVIINISLGNDNEARRQFVGWDGREFEIERGKDVSVPRGLLEVLDNAVLGVPETDPMDPMKTIIVQRKRFPYSIVGVVEQ